MSAPTPVNPPSPNRCVLLTGFDAFGGATLNPSWLAAVALHGKTIKNHAVVSRQLPTSFAHATKVLTSLIKRHQPCLVICVGQAGGRSAVSLERIAINIQDARIADNTGAKPIDVPVVKSGPAAYFSTLPIKAVQRALMHEGITCEISQTAGTFVCNHVFYTLMHTLNKQRNTAGAKGGFIHVPYLPGQGLPCMPCMPLNDMVRGLEIAIACALTTNIDALIGAGQLN